MFKQTPDIVSKECGNVEYENYTVNWEDIAKWALENGNVENGGNACGSNDTGPNIDWCKIAESFMRDEADETEYDICDTGEMNVSLQEHDRPILFLDTAYSSHRACSGYEELPSPIPRRERSSRSPKSRRTRSSGRSNYSEVRSMRDSDFNDTSGCNRTPLSPGRDFSCMEEDFMNDSTHNYESDIMSYLEGRAERNRPHSIAEGYHFPGRSYGRGNDCDGYNMYTSTPKKKKHRTTRAETFEMADGSKMFNVTFDECLDFGRKLRHVSDVRDDNGCQVMYLDREIDEDANGAKHRVDIARRWIN